MSEIQNVQSIFDQVLSQMDKAQRSHLAHVQIALGEISELNAEKLQTHWRELTKNTPAEHAELSIRLIKAEVQCMACFDKYHPEGGEIHCPYCGSYGAKILAGEECYLESVETTDS